jgi:hypothetical protein
MNNTNAAAIDVIHFTNKNPSNTTSTAVFSPLRQSLCAAQPAIAVISPRTKLTAGNDAMPLGPRTRP